ncbi:short chain dehydrogenase [Apiospora arundinis]|uniref:Short chain dehydrogenase n=1 Tax=Apiospora arundinis TaxID=335852 RepID=A0ABR2J535_9PEZI
MSSTWSDTTRTVGGEEEQQQPPHQQQQHQQQEEAAAAAAAVVLPSSRSPVALITAGSAGVGAATARLLARRGYRVVINFSRNTERARKVVGELQQLSRLPAHEIQNEHGNAFLAIRADLGRRDEIGRLVRETVVQMGRLDVLFSNGGWTKFRDMTSIDDNTIEEDWDMSFNINVKSHLWLMQAAKKHLDESEGVFITTASAAGMTPSGSSLAYSVTKAAQIHLVKNLAVMAAPRIRVNSVSPGLLLTEWSDRFSEQAKDAWRQKTKLKRFPTVEDVAEQVLTFAKSRSMTGVNIPIDAGFIN